MSTIADKSASNAEIDWYGGGLNRNGGRRIVTIERMGQVAIGSDLLADWPDGHAFALPGYIRRRAILVFKPVREAEKGCITLQRSRIDNRAARLSLAAALRRWGLLTGEIRRCTASWVGGMLWVTLPGAGKEDSTTEVTESTETPEKEESANAPTPTSDTPPATDGDPTDRIDPVDRVDGKPARPDDRPPRCCRNCTWQKFRLCTNQGCEEHRNKNVSLDGVCDQHFYVLHLRRAGETDPRPERPHTTLTPAQREASRCVPQTGRAQQSPAKQGRRPATGQMGSRPRGLCSVSDHGGKDFPISGRGIGKHDVAGRHCTSIDYDKNNICPGSNKPPRD